MSDGALCRNCLYWMSGNGEEGDCRRYPPHSSGEFEIRFPWTGASDWCGEHKPKPMPARPLRQEDFEYDPWSRERDPHP